MSMVGRTIAHYAITAKIGRGGMGEVYLATDSRLKRKVAIKVLSEALAGDEMHLARLTREAEVLASLDHPGIAQIYGIEEIDGGKALILQLIEGPTLADRIKRGPIPVEEALTIALEIAEALEAAHDRGVIHRDLKPANIKITPDGKVKILDFGLAKAVIEEKTAAELADSPTLTGQTTQTGLILGTASYMSPEQARGLVADHRSDIWSFAAVVFEMLTGQQPFEGDDIAEVLASVVKVDVDWEALPSGVPDTVAWWLRRCLQADPKQRCHSIADIRLVLQGYSEIAPLQPAPSKKTWWAAAAGFVLAVPLLWLLFTVLESYEEGSTPRTSSLSRTTIDLSSEAHLPQVTFVGIDGPKVAISPDGDQIVYVGESGESTALFLRKLDSFEVTRIPGTEGATHPFFSPDGLWLGFLTNEQVRKVSLRGDPPQTLCRADSPTRAIWSTEDQVYFADNVGKVLASVPAKGGPARIRANVGSLFPGDEWTSVSDVARNGKYALVSVWSRSMSADYADVYLMEIGTQETKLLIRSGYDARFVPGYMVFARSGSLLAVRWDSERVGISGEPVPALSGVRMESFFGQAQFAVSVSGSLVFVPGGVQSVGKIASVDRRGQVEILNVPEQTYGAISAAPDGKQLAVDVADLEDYVWIYDLERRGGRKFTSGKVPIWSPQSDSLAYSARAQDGTWRMLLRSVGPDSQPRQVFSSVPPVHVSSWAPDRSSLAIFSQGASDYFIGFLSIAEKSLTQKIAEPGVVLLFPDYSPDGKWVTYSSVKTGRHEVWVRSVEDKGTVRQITTEGGLEPVWTTGGEILYRSGNQWMTVAVRTEPQLDWDPPQALFATDFIDTPSGTWDVSPDGQRVFLFKSTARYDRTKIRLVSNWLEELNRLLDAG